MQIITVHNFKDDPDGVDDIVFGPFHNVALAEEFGRTLTAPYSDFLTFRVSELRGPVIPGGPDPLRLFGHT